VTSGYRGIISQKTDSLLGNAHESNMSARQRLETETEERCFLYGPCRDVISGQLAESRQFYSDKKQTRPLVREGTPQRQDRDCQTVINIWS
jgi:hypothetical protein